MSREFEIAAKQAARSAGWTFHTANELWTHPDHATFDGSAAELCEHYRLQILDKNGLVVLTETDKDALAAYRLEA